FFGGIHGNEPSGVFALRKVLDEIKQSGLVINGNVFAIAGNLTALRNGVRYADTDLNRLWTREFIHPDLTPKEEKMHDSVEHHEMSSLLEVLRNIKSSCSDPFYFIDLHSTSSGSSPFLTINDTILNRKFALRYRVPIILGIEEYLNGPLLSYLNLSGYVSVGFEAGQHDSIDTILAHESFIYKTLSITGCLNNLPSNNKKTVEGNNTVEPKIFEILFRYEIGKGEKFRMNNGFTNFQSIRKGCPLAISNQKVLFAPSSGRIFMPLYQDQGDDGFFIIRKVPFVLLKISAFLRKIKLDRMLALLPGINWEDEQQKIIIVNRRIAKFFAKDFLHILGFRLIQRTRFQLTARKREDDVLNKRYRKESWA
ncbi:MAG: succinylglutamate desuccinylase/aspartoacylase family protein, partial [Cyclobacteriaceae bacterium]